jgi:hypothetical protein
MSPRTARKFWVATFAGLGIFDLWLAKNATDGDSLSEVAREVFRTETPAGRAALIGFWGALSAWLIPHLLRRVKEEMA